MTAILASGPCACGEVAITVGRIVTVTGMHTLQHCVSHEGLESLRKLGMISASDAASISAIPWRRSPLHCGCCGIELKPESETFSGETPLCKPCGRAAAIAFEEANRRLDIEVAARAFLAKLEACEPAMRGVAQIAAAHGMPYVGPNYAAEKAALAAVLTEDSPSS
jgi:hypothetical protein